MNAFTFGSTGHTLAPSRAALAEACYTNAYRALVGGRTSQSACLFLVLVLLEPDTERAWAGVGVCQERSGRLPLAAAFYGLGSRRLGHRSPWLALGQGRTLGALGRRREALAAFDRAEGTTEDPRILQAIEEARCQ